MRCLACNTNLSDFEATRKYEDKKTYVDLCNRCWYSSQMIEDNIMVLERADLEHDETTTTSTKPSDWEEQMPELRQEWERQAWWQSNPIWKWRRSLLLLLRIHWIRNTRKQNPQDLARWSTYTTKTNEPTRGHRTSVKGNQRLFVAVPILGQYTGWYALVRKGAMADIPLLPRRKVSCLASERLLWEKKVANIW